MTRILATEPDDLRVAMGFLQKGGLVGLPTETVYGLAARGSDARAVARIYEVKGRPAFNPLIAHIANVPMAQRHGIFSPTALALANTFWPGPLTIVVPLRAESNVCDLALAGLDTIALRYPNSHAMRSLIQALDEPLVAPSANKSGRLSPTCVAHVLADLDGQIEAVMDGGPCKFGLESTIISVFGDQISLLRQGAVPRDVLEMFAGPVRIAQPQDKVSAPGMLARHYAPKARLRLNATHAEPGEALLAMGPGWPQANMNLSEANEWLEAAANLFSMLRALDDAGFAQIAVVPIPELSLGEAINDRLRRASTQE